MRSHLFSAVKKHRVPSHWWTSDGLPAFQNVSAFGMQLPLPVGEIALPQVAFLTAIIRKFGRCGAVKRSSA